MADAIGFGAATRLRDAGGLRGTNLLDSLYRTEYGFPDPGRQVWAGARVAFARGGGRNDDGVGLGDRE